MRGAFLLALALPSLVFAAGCAVRRPARSGHSSPSALAVALVQALSAGDRSALRALALSEAEFRDVVWPALPASRPERNIPWDYAWQDLKGKSDAHLEARLAAWEDRGYRVISVAFAGETTDHGSFRVRRHSTVTLIDSVGQETRTRLFGSLIEMDGRYKVFSYVVD